MTTSTATASLPTFADVASAAERLAGHAHRTPVLTSATLDQRVGGEIFVKCESFQKVGAFKYRGALNALSRLGDADRQRGVIAYSSGNHAQAIARVGGELGIRTVIVMPNDAPEIKRRATAGYGADVVLHDPAAITREAVAADLIAEHGYTLVPPFDHRDIIAGQGTVGLEFLDDVDLDTLLVPCGGGGLLTGSAVAAGRRRPSCRVIGVEPELADDATRSFHSGELQRVDNPRTIADGTRTASMGRLTFPLMLDHVADMVTVSEQAICEAVAFFFYRMKLVVEPSGALGLAALLSGTIEAAGRVGLVVSGGNVDAATFREVLARVESELPRNEDIPGQLSK